ncbi:MAG: glutathione S-transferase family protein, partial [Candidatus Puniceispirillum sp.]
MSLILHHYPQSPVAHKTRMALGIAGATWQSVEIPRIPPKPLLMPLTAGYRRTPVLQIGADIYCDSQNIVRALEEYGCPNSLFPDGVTGRSMMMASWSESTLFDLAVRVVITNALDTAPADFIADRGALYFEKDWSPETLRADMPGVLLRLQAGLAWAEFQLVASDGVFLNGDTPCYADAAIGYIAWFLRGRWDSGTGFLAPFEQVCKLESALADIGEGTSSDLSGEDALAIAKAANPVSPTGVSVPFTAG